MNFKVIQLISAGIIFALPSLMGIIDTNRFDAKPKERLKYLNYMMPKELRFSAPAIEADRGNLLLIVSEPTPVPSNIIEADSNQSAEPSFPVVSYDDPETTEIFDLTGVLVASSNKSKINIASFSKGVYLVKVVYGDIINVVPLSKVEGN